LISQSFNIVHSEYTLLKKYQQTASVCGLFN